jgi:hypothetical protein
MRIWIIEFLSMFFLLHYYVRKRAYGLGSQCRPNECLFWVGKPRGVGISGGEGARWQDGEMQGSVYEQPKREVDGSHHSKEGSK